MGSPWKELSLGVMGIIEWLWKASWKLLPLPIFWNWLFPSIPKEEL